MLRRPRILFALAFGLLALAPGRVSAYLEEIGIENPPVFENQPLTVNVFGQSPDGCYTPSIADEGIGLVEPGRIRVIVDLVYDAPPGVTCPAVLVPYELQQTFDAGFPAGTYVVEVLERRVDQDGDVREESLEIGLEIASTEPPVRHVNAAWGAVKALYAD